MKPGARWVARFGRVAVVLLAAHHLLVWISLRRLIFPGVRLPAHTGRNARAAARCELVLTTGRSHQESWFHRGAATIVDFVVSVLGPP